MNHRNLLTKKQQRVMSDDFNKHIEVKQYFLIKITTKLHLYNPKTIFAFKLFEFIFFNSFIKEKNELLNA
jgi:hypothetical protein